MTFLMDLPQDGDFQTVLGWADKFRKLRVDAHIHSNTDMVAQVHSIICITSVMLFFAPYTGNIFYDDIILMEQFINFELSIMFHADHVLFL